MILGRDKQAASACFEELDDAVRAITERLVCFNAHLYAVPEGGIIYNLEDIHGYVDNLPTTRWAGHEMWDAVEANAKQYGATYVPIGYHRSMVRFAPAEVQDIDVLLYGCMNERRNKLLQGLADRGLHVVAASGSYGKERDALLARAKVVLNVPFFEGRSWPTLRAAHLVANRVLMVSEKMDDAWPFVASAPYDHVVDMAEAYARAPACTREWETRKTLKEFEKMPLKLPGQLLPAIRPSSVMAAAMEHDWASHGHPLPPDPWVMLRGPSASWDVEAMYTSHRGTPVSATPQVHMIVPTYRETVDIMQSTERSRVAIQEDLAAHGIANARATIHGDSLVQRMRQRGVNQFMKSTATHLLWCDLDIEAMDPTCVRKMLATGHDVIAGACPFKSNEGRVVCNLWPHTHQTMKDTGQLIAPGNCIEVQDAGTGFMLVSRTAIAQMMQAYPELLHWSKSKSDLGEPLWALYDTGVVDGVYQSEDFMFCHLWQRLGGKVYVHMPSTFRHYGTHGFEGSLTGQLGLEAAMVAR